MRLSGQLPADAGASLAVALTRPAEQAGPDSETGRYDPFDSRCADALVELAGARLADDADPDRATVVVHVPAEWLASLGGGAAAGVRSG